MAKLLNLACDDGSHSYNLLTGTLKLVEGSRNKIFSEKTISETMDLISEVGSTDKNIILAENMISDLGDFAQKWKMDRTKQYAVWLEENTTSESKRRSLVVDAKIVQQDGNNTSMLLGRQGVSIWTLYLEYMPWWEKGTGDEKTFSSIYAWGGKCNIIPSAYNEGTIDGRIYYATVNPLAACALTEFWFGIRAPRETADPTEFQPIWELEKCSQYIGSDISTGSEVGASPLGSTTNNKIVCSFATNPGMFNRIILRLNDAWEGAGSHYEHMAGRYLVLMRCKVDASTIARIRMFAGYEASLRVYPDVDISNTSWMLIPMGEVTFPATGFRGEMAAVGAAALGENAIKMAAQRVSGSGSLHMDALCFIPTDAMIYALVSDPVNLTHKMIWYTFADGTRVAVRANTADVPQGNGEFFMPNWWLPRTGGYGVFAGQNHYADTHLLTDQCDIHLDFYARFKNFSPYA